MTRTHVSQMLACQRRWFDGRVMHLCRAHVIETDACVCPCGAVRIARACDDESPRPERSSEGLA